MNASFPIDQRIDVFLRSGALGDQIMFLPALYALRERCSRNDHSWLTFWTNSRTIAPLVLEQGLADEVKVGGAPFVDPVLWTRLPEDDQGRAHWEMLGKPDLVYAYLFDLVGMDPKLDDLRSHCQLIAEKWIGHDRMLQVDRFLRPLGTELNHHTWSQIDRREQRERTPLAVVHPGAGQTLKVWPYYEQLIARLLERNYQVAVTCGPHDLQTVYRLKIDRSLIREHLSVLDLTVLLRDATVYIGNDTGPTHLAAYLGTPTVAIFGPTDPDVWRPAGPRVRVLRNCDEHEPRWIVLPHCQTHNCIARITVDQVLEAVDALAS